MLDWLTSSVEQILVTFVMAYLCCETINGIRYRNLFVYVCVSAHSTTPTLAVRFYVVQYIVFVTLLVRLSTRRWRTSHRLFSVDLVAVATLGRLSLPAV
jgi:hypothetical protein